MRLTIIIAHSLELKTILPENILQTVAYIDPFYLDSSAPHSSPHTYLPDVVQNTHPSEPTYADSRTPAKRPVELNDEDEDEEMAPPPPKKPVRRSARAASREPESATPMTAPSATGQTAPTPRRVRTLFPMRTLNTLGVV